METWLSQLTGSDLILFNVVFIILMFWSLVWKGIALWQAAQNSAKAWFIALLIVNTVGILEMIYIFIISRNKENA